MSAHSPGPWRWDRDGLHLADANDGKPQPVTNWRDPPSHTSHVMCLCEDHGMKPTEADARLIEAAPELLILAERQLAWIEKALAAFEGESDPSEIEGKNIAAESAALLLRIQRP